MAVLGDAAHGVAELELRVCRGEGLAVVDGNLLLARSVLVDRLLDVDALDLEGVDDVVHDDRRAVHAGRRVDGPVAERDRPAIAHLGEVELVLERGTDADSAPGGGLDHALQEAAGAAAPVEAIVIELVADEAGGARDPRQSRVRRRVRHEADLADRLHALDVDELLEHVDGVLGPGQADPFAHPPREMIDVDVLAADDAARIAIEEPNQPHVIVDGTADDVIHQHVHSRPRSRRKGSAVEGGRGRPPVYGPNAAEDSPASCGGDRMVSVAGRVGRLGRLGSSGQHAGPRHWPEQGCRGRYRHVFEHHISSGSIRKNPRPIARGIRADPADHVDARSGRRSTCPGCTPAGSNSSPRLGQRRNTPPRMTRPPLPPKPMRKRSFVRR